MLLELFFTFFLQKRFAHSKWSQRLEAKNKKKILEASKHHMIIHDSKLDVEIWIEVYFQ